MSGSCPPHHPEDEGGRPGRNFPALAKSVAPAGPVPGEGRSGSTEPKANFSGWAFTSDLEGRPFRFVAVVKSIRCLCSEMPREQWDGSAADFCMVLNKPLAGLRKFCKYNESANVRDSKVWF